MKLGSVDATLALYTTHGADRYDEEITQLEHALQTAALAVADGATDDLVVAALLHDVGHLLELAAGAADPGRIDDHHESTGANCLSDLFPKEVTFPIALHVRAKRYLCAVDPSYHSTLSEGSKRSLELQGGAFEPADLSAFEQLAGAEASVQLRRWDDLGKIDGLTVQPLDDYREVLARVAQAPC